MFIIPPKYKSDTTNMYFPGTVPDAATLPKVNLPHLQYHRPGRPPVIITDQGVLL